MAARSATIVVEHETGLHARPASMLVRTASKFETDISVRKTDGETEVDAKNSITVLSLGIGLDEEIAITADDSDSEQAAERLVELIRNDSDLDA